MAYDLKASPVSTWSDKDPAAVPTVRASVAARNALAASREYRETKRKERAGPPPSAYEEAALLEAARKAARLKAARSAASLKAAEESFPDGVVLDTSPTLPRSAVVGESGALHIVETDSWDHLPAEELFCARDVDETAVEEVAELIRRVPEFARICARTAGEIISEEAAAEGAEGQALVHETSLEIALTLVAGGVAAFRKNHKGFHLVDPLTRAARYIHPYRNICFIPAVGAARKRKLLPHLQHLFEHRRKQAALVTLTWGERIALDVPGALRDGIQSMIRAYSNMTASPDFKRYGAESVFRGVEFGTVYRACRWPRAAVPTLPGVHAEGRECKGWTWLPADQLDHGTLWFHLHIHAFLLFRTVLENGEFGAWMRAMWGKEPGVSRLWPYHWSYDKKIQRPAEACKYPIKALDLRTANLRPAEAVALFRETMGLHLHQCSGELREKRADRYAKALRGTRQIDSHGTHYVSWGPDWNAAGPRDMEAKKATAKRSARRRKAKRARYTVAAQLLAAADRPCSRRSLADREAARYLAAWIALKMPQTSVEARWCPNIEKIEAAEAAAKPAAAPGLRILGRVAPGPHFDRVKRPALFVQGFTGSPADWEDIMARPMVKEICNIAGPRCAAAEQELRHEAAVSGRSGPEAPYTEFTPSSKLLLRHEDQTEALNLEANA